MFYETIQTPAYILEEDKLRKNCELFSFWREILIKSNTKPF